MTTVLDLVDNLVLVAGKTANLEEYELPRALEEIRRGDLCAVITREATQVQKFDARIHGWPIGTALTDASKGQPIQIMQGWAPSTGYWIWVVKDRAKETWEKVKADLQKSSNNYMT